MLSEELVEELTRPTPLQQRLVELAWPALSTESRLQVLAQNRDMPSWLLSLALSDEQPIVRYWGARRAPPRPDNAWRAKYGFPLVEVVDDGSTARIGEDACELVRAHADDRPYYEAGQLSRLVRLRAGRLLLDAPVHWMIKALENGAPEQEIYEFAVEFFEQPQVKRDLAQAEPVGDEGFSDYRNGETLRTLWKLFGCASPQLRSYLLWRIPFNYRGHGIGTDGIARLPTDALVAITSAYGKRFDVRMAKHQILKWPDNYPADKVEKMRELTADDEPSEEELIREWRDKQNAGADDTENLLRNEVASLRDELRGLRKELQEVLAGQAAAKRKWF